MISSAPGAVHGALLGTVVLVAAMVYVGRSPGAPRSLAAFALSFSLHALRYLLMALEPVFGETALAVAAECAHAASAVVMVFAIMVDRRQLAPWGALGGIWLVLVGWVVFAIPNWGMAVASIPVHGFAGGTMIAAGIAFMRRARRTPKAGYEAVSFLFIAWGLHKWDFPLVVWLAPQWLAYGFLVTQGLATGLGVALVVAYDRERRRNEDEARRHAQALMRLQGEAMAATANAIFITDRAGRIEWCNDAFSRLTGWTPHQAKGRAARRLLMGVERDRRLQEALLAGRPWHGELSLRAKDGTLYVVDQTVTPIADDRGRINHYVVVQEDVTERRRAEERIRFLSNHDALTALPNRLLFREHLQRSVARGKPFAVLFLDLDDFSHYNDVLGHDGGDRLLLAVVERLMAAGRGLETIARVGGDEFAFILADDGANAAASLAQELIAAVIRPQELDGHEVQMGCSVGIALYPADGTDAEALMKNADVAMYRAIREAPNGYRFFAAAMDEELSARRRLESDLRRAIPRDELEVHYQPIVDTKTRKLIALEALVRWRHAEDGLILPGAFIPLAEENGLIGAIGEWVLRETCQQLRRWSDDGVPLVPVAVNLSAVQMRRQDLPILVRRIMAESRAPGGRLELELTESTVMEDAEAAQRTLNEIKALGVNLAVDDFGTGYSSLARLKRFPVGKLKIDRSFVSDLAEDESDAAIARAIISLAHALDLKVVAEGVETEAQMAILAKEGCDAVQGFLFSPPVPAAQAEEFLRRGGF